MTKLENIKYLRSIGASHKLMDDVAKKVGGYESPLFVPTVEFILKLQNVLSTNKQQEQGVSTAQLPTSFDPAKMQGVDLESAIEVVQGGKGKKGNKKQAVAYIEGMVVKREQFLQDNPDFDAEKNLIPRRKSNKKQVQSQQKQAQKSNLMSYLANAVKAMLEQVNEQIADRAQNAQVAQQQNRQQGQQQNQQQTRQSQQQQNVKTSQRKNLMSLFKTKIAQVMASQHEHHDQKPVDKKSPREEFLKKLKQDVRVQDVQNNHKVTDKDLLQAAKKVKTENPEISKDLFVSKLIDTVVKNAAEHKKNDKKQPSIEDAVAKLQSTGVKSINSPDQQIDNKKALEDQHKLMTEQNANIKR